MKTIKTDSNMSKWNTPTSNCLKLTSVELTRPQRLVRFQLNTNYTAYLYWPKFQLANK